MELKKLIDEVFFEVTENYYTIKEFSDQLFKLKNFDISFDNKKVGFNEREFNFKNKVLMLGSYSFPKLGSFKISESNNGGFKFESDAGFIIDAVKVKKLSNGNFHAVKMDIYKK